MRIAGRNPTSLFDGVGLNYVVFFQGCEHRCAGCQNPSTWSKDGGLEITLSDLQADIERYQPLITGITLSGGDPVYQLDAALELARWARQHRLTVTLYTGFTLSSLRAIEGVCAQFDYIIDGCFRAECRSGELAFRGSSNQRVWLSDGYGVRDISRLVDGDHARR